MNLAAGRPQENTAPLGREQRGSGRTAPARLAARARLVQRYHFPPTAKFVKETEHAVTVFLSRRGRPAVGKFFASTPAARAALAAEQKSWELFCMQPWRMPILHWSRHGFLVPRLDDGDRLDARALHMSARERLDAGAWAVEVLLQIHLAGYFHGDLQPHNVWFLGDRLVATDFETFGRRSPGVPFLSSADITGFDPGRTERLDPAFDPQDSWSFHHALGVSLDTAIAAARERLSAQSGPRSVRLLAALDGSTI